MQFNLSMKQGMQASLSSSPISTVPIEILLRIFHIGSHDSSNDSDAIDFPVLVSHICRGWREVAVHTSTLWSTIVVTSFTSPVVASLPTSTESSSPAAHFIPSFPFVRMFLERAGSLPLTIYLDLRSPSHNLWTSDLIVDQDFSSDHIHALLGLLLPQAARFTEFTLLSDIWQTIFFALARLQRVRMPMLEKWDVRRCNLYHCFKDEFRPGPFRTPVPLLGDTEDGATKVEAAAKYPRLKEVILSGTHVAWPSWSVGKLSCLTINYLAREVRPSFISLRRILLGNSGTLTRLEIQGAAPVRAADDGRPGADFSESDIGSIFLPALVELVIGYTTPAEVVPPVLALNAPNLKDLQLVDLERQFGVDPFDDSRGLRDSKDATPLFEALLTYMPLPVCSIERLTLRSVGFGPSEDEAVISVLGSEVDIRPYNLDARVLMPLRLLFSLTELNSLSMDHPDPAMLRALNTPLRDFSANTDDRGKLTVLPAPHLSRLSLTHCPHVIDFLRSRENIRDLPYVSSHVCAWEELTVGVRGGDVVWSVVSMKEELNLCLLAKKVKVIDEAVPFDDHLYDDENIDLDEVDAWVEQWGDDMDE